MGGGIAQQLTRVRPLCGSISLIISDAPLLSHFSQALQRFRMSLFARLGIVIPGSVSRRLVGQTPTATRMLVWITSEVFALYYCGKDR